MNPVDVPTPLRGAAFSDFFQVDAPVAATDDVRGEWFPSQHSAGLVRFQVRAQRHGGGEEPRGRAKADEVVVARLRLVGNPNLPRLPPQLRPEQREDAEDRVPKGKYLEVLRVVRIRELDLGLGDVAAASA